MLQQIGRGAAGGAGCGIAVADPEARLETVVAQQPQHILGDAGGGIADKADAACTQIGETAHGIADRPVGAEKDCVDREVAARRVGRPIGVEGDAGMAAESLDVAAQGGDLEMPRRDYRGHGAMRETGRHHPDAALFENFDDPLGRRRGGDVDVAAPGRAGDLRPDQRVPHRAADETGLDPARRERLEHRPGRRLGQPFRRRDLPAILAAILGGAGHRGGWGSIWPGTILPFSQRGAT